MQSLCSTAILRFQAQYRLYSEGQADNYKALSAVYRTARRLPSCIANSFLIQQILYSHINRRTHKFRCFRRRRDKHLTVATERLESLSADLFDSFRNYDTRKIDHTAGKCFICYRRYREGRTAGFHPRRDTQNLIVSGIPCYNRLSVFYIKLKPVFIFQYPNCTRCRQSPSAVTVSSASPVFFAVTVPLESTVIILVSEEAKESSSVFALLGNTLTGSVTASP